MSLKLITPPASEPITLDEVFEHLRISSGDSDNIIYGMIVAARQAAEHATGRCLITQTWDMYYDDFKEEIRIPLSPLVSVEYVKYIDLNGDLVTLDPVNYKLDAISQPCRLMPSYGLSFPCARHENNAITVRFIVGYGDADSVPQAIKQWILLRIGALFENREAFSGGGNIVELPGRFTDSLLDPYRVVGFL